MFTTGFGFFILATITVLTIGICVYHCNKVDRAAEVRKEELYVERMKVQIELDKINLEKEKLKKK